MSKEKKAGHIWSVD